MDGRVRVRVRITTVRSTELQQVSPLEPDQLSALLPEEDVVNQANLVHSFDDLAHIHVLIDAVDALLKQNHQFLLLPGPTSTQQKPRDVEHLPFGVDEVLVFFYVLKQSGLDVLV